jgi:hypothetical protein
LQPETARREPYLTTPGTGCAERFGPLAREAASDKPGPLPKVDSTVRHFM